MATKQYASIRSENPGAQWDSNLARKFGMMKWELLADGNHIAIFPDHIHGAACNMALLDQSYTGMTISAGQKKWSGQHRAGLPGWKDDTVITKKMCSDPKFMIPFMKAIAEFEAPGGSTHVTDKDWQDAFWLYRNTIYKEQKPEAKPLEPVSPKPLPSPAVPDPWWVKGLKKIGWK